VLITGPYDLIHKLTPNMEFNYMHANVLALRFLFDMGTLHEDTYKLNIKPSRMIDSIMYIVAPEGELNLDLFSNDFMSYILVMLVCYSPEVDQRFRKTLISFKESAEVQKVLKKAPTKVKTIINYMPLTLRENIGATLRDNACFDCILDYIIGRKDEINLCTKCITAEAVLDGVEEALDDVKDDYNNTQNVVVSVNFHINKVLEKTKARLVSNMATVQDLKKHLYKYVQGQDLLVDKLSTLAAAYLKCNALQFGQEVTTPVRLNVLISGTTGTGKTYTVEKLAEAVGLPVISIDASTLTPSGYKGEDLDSLCVKGKRDVEAFYHNSNHKFYPYILYFDELDKILSGDQGFYVGVQNTMLRCVEKGLDFHSLNLNRFSFPFVIMSGSFMSPLQQNIEQKNFGFLEDKSPKTTAMQLTPKKLQEFGVLPELAGRFSYLLATRDLQAEDYIALLKEKEDSPLTKVLKLHDSINEFDKISQEELDKVIQEAAITAVATNTGVRGLESSLLDRLFFQRVLK
jgi:ATP-dependent Clp protease ATP-binding subunit ClpX